MIYFLSHCNLYFRILRKITEATWLLFQQGSSFYGENCWEGRQFSSHSNLTPYQANVQAICQVILPISSIFLTKVTGFRSKLFCYVSQSVTSSYFLLPVGYRYIFKFHLFFFHFKPTCITCCILGFFKTVQTQSAAVISCTHLDFVMHIQWTELLRKGSQAMAFVLLNWKGDRSIFRGKVLSKITTQKFRLPLCKSLSSNQHFQKHCPHKKPTCNNGENSLCTTHSHGSMKFGKK